MSVLVLVTPPAAALMTEVELAETGRLVIVNVVEVVPPGTVTLTGTVAAEVLPLVSVTTVPLPGAMLVRVIVPTEDTPA